jgi:hypothetical protein
METDPGELVQNFARSEPIISMSAAEGGHPPTGVMGSRNSFLGDYISYRDQTGPDPRTAALAVVADHLCRIIEIEGPMLAKRAYDIYLRGCGIRRLGPELKSTLNKALASAVRQGRIVSENEPGKSGFLFSTVRITGSPAVKLRCRGPRTFEEIPPGELRAVGRYISENLRCNPGTDEHLRTILEYFELKRLTTQVGSRLLEILDNPDGNAETLLDRVASN